VEVESTIVYNVDAEDEAWLGNHPRFGSRSAALMIQKERSATAELEDVDSVKQDVKKQKTSSNNAQTTGSSQNEGKETEKCHGDDDIRKLDINVVRRRPVLPLSILEQMLNILEEATGFETIVTDSHAERLILSKIPQLGHIFGLTVSAASAISNRGRTKERQRRDRSVVTAKHVVNDVYSYWVQKRSKLKKPLMRQFWPVTATNDTNPHLVFRPREKEKYKLRKKRQNDLDAYRKMKQLRSDFDKVRILLDLVRRREIVHKTLINLDIELCEQQLFDMCDTSSLPRVSSRVSKEEVDTLLNVPKYFDTTTLSSSGSRKKKRRRSTDGIESPSPATLSGELEEGKMYASTEQGSSITAPSIPVVIAGKDNGTPAPLFLHPLATRESYVTSWDNAVPFIPSFENSIPAPTHRFRHRPRIGRGGRVIIDRIPQPVHPSVPHVNVYTAGEGLARYGGDAKPPERLLDLLPVPLDKHALSLRIEEICSAALSEDEDGPSSSAVISTQGTAAIDAEDNDGEQVLVSIDDWLDTDEQPWGEERFVIGPI
jgi:enhancer of polycomb-like protein